MAEIMAPMIFQFGQSELAAYTRAVADACPIPLAIYHHKRMPTAYAVETMAELARHPNIVAMKDTSADLARLGRLLNATAGTGLAVFQGCEDLFCDSLKAGAAGCVSALANVAPEWHVALYRAHRSGDAAEAERYQQLLNSLHQIFRHELTASSFSYFTYALKRILRHRGWLEHAQSSMPGFQPAAEFDAFIDGHIRRLGLNGKVAT